MGRGRQLDDVETRARRASRSALKGKMVSLGEDVFKTPLLILGSTTAQSIEMRLGSDEHKRLSMLRYIACAPMYYRTESALRYL